MTPIMYIEFNNSDYRVFALTDDLDNKMTKFPSSDIRSVYRASDNWFTEIYNGIPINSVEIDDVRKILDYKISNKPSRYTVIGKEITEEFRKHFGNKTVHDTWTPSEKTKFKLMFC